MKTSPASPSIFIDFDHTLFDTDAFRESLAGSVHSVGIDAAMFHGAFEATTDGMGDKPFDLVSQARKLTEWTGVDPDVLVSRMIRVVNDSATFLYSDAAVFLDDLHKWGITTTLVTYANEQLRNWQLDATNVRGFLDKSVIVTSGRSGKVKYLLDHVSPHRHNSIVIEDHPAILAPLVSSNALLLRIRRKVRPEYAGREPKLPGVPVFSSLTDAYEFMIPTLSSLAKVRS